jgi:hypothetical protein
MALKMYLFEPDRMYSGGALAVAAESLEQAISLVADASVDWNTEMRPVTETYCVERREFVPLPVPHVPGVSISGKPRVLFDYTYEE